MIKFAVLLTGISLCYTGTEAYSQNAKTGTTQTEIALAKTPAEKIITGDQPGRYKTIGEIERLDDELNKLIPADAMIEVLAEGFSWAEGPVWVSDGGYLLFSDVPENKIYKWKEGEGKSLYLTPSGYTGAGYYSGEPGSNGLMIGADGKLLLCQHGERRIAKMKNDLNNPTPEFIPVADHYQGKKLNSPNDLALYKDGSIYFTDPPYGLPNQQNATTQELGFYGVFRVDQKGKMTLITDKLTRPNGIAFSPDFSTCYVNVSDPEHAVVMAYDVNTKDGTFSNERILFNATPLVPSKKGLPDGLKVHPENGSIFTSGPGGILVLSPGGKHIGTINTGQATSNCAFDEDLNYLYVTADSYFLRVKLVKKNK